MTKAELVTEVAAKSGLNKKQTELAINAVIGTITDALTKGDSVQLVGFGTFEVRDRAARKGVNPQNPSQRIDIPATKVPAFKAGKALKDAISD